MVEAEGDIVIGNNLEWRPLWEARFPNALDDAETFRVNGNGFLVEIGKKPESMDEIEGQYMGLIKFTPAGWATVEEALSAMTPERRNRIDVTALLQILLEDGTRIETTPIRDFWFEIDSTSDLALCGRMMSEAQR